MKAIFTFIPTRFVFCGMAFLGYFNLYTLRNTLAVAIVEMNDKRVIPKEIWGLPSQDVIQCSFYPLYIVANFITGSITARIGGKIVFGLGTAMTAVLGCMMPFVTQYGFIPLMAIRVLQGIFEGFSIASIFTMYGKWFPKSERARLFGICYAGFSVGFLVGQPITGYLCASKLLGGWPSVFYVFGFLALVWFLIWCLIVYESPSEHPWISTKELNYILEDQGDEYARKNVIVPWREILSCPAVLCLAITGPISGTLTEFIRMDYPSYLKNVFQYDITKIGWLSTVPHFLTMTGSAFAGFLGDYIINRNPTCRKTLIRKCFNLAAHLLSTIALLVITQLSLNPVAIVSIITFALGILSLNVAGSQMTPIELGPVFAGTVYGIINGSQNLSAFFTPLLVGAITAGKQSSKEAWNTIFYIAAGANIVTSALFLLFGSADLQPWGLGEENRSVTLEPSVSIAKTVETSTNCSPKNLISYQAGATSRCSDTDKETDLKVIYSTM